MVVVLRNFDIFEVKDRRVNINEVSNCVIFVRCVECVQQL